MADFESDVMRSLGRIEQKVDDHGDRIKSLEHHNEVQEWRDWIKVGIVIPVITGLHAILNRLGIKV